MNFTSVNDELLHLKQKVIALGLEVIKVEKIGNGNMSAFQLFYRKPGEHETKVAYFWRHDLDNFFLEFEAAIKAGIN